MSDPDARDVGKARPEGWHRAVTVSTIRAIVASLLIVGASLITTSAIDDRRILAIAAFFYVSFWMAIFVIYFRYQLLAIRRSGFPLIRGIETLVIGIVLFLTIFAKAYLLIAMGDPGSFSEPMDHFTSYYFAVTVLATVGFGDISPSSVPARSIAMVQMLLDLVIIAIAVRLVTTEVRNATARRRAAS